MCPLLCFSFICAPITTKLGVMVLWDKLSKAIKILLTSSPGGKHDVIKPFLVSLQVKTRVPLSFVQWSWNLAQESILRCWFRIRAKKSDINTFWRRKRPFFYEKLTFLPKRSLIKVLPWQHPRLLLTENYFKWCPI